MRTFELHSAVLIRRTPEEIFPFFADARNLDLLTPPWLHFQIVDPAPVAIQAGTEIDYRLRLRGIPLRWRSRITAWDPPALFVDEQVRGPYRRWIHQHRFRPVAAGTLVEDQVSYAVWGGRLVDRWLIAPDLSRIFRYRRERLLERFPESKGAPCQSSGSN
ncbi:MAG: SRPBCC family protein [Acidobacteria bacterium]|nr:SRPBCC family protein [Acidobacteriota bacterium]